MSCYPSTTYSYELTANNAFGSSGESVAATATTEVSQAFGGALPAEDFTATPSSPNTVNLSWTDNDAANANNGGYYWEVERSTNGMSYQIIAAISPASSGAAITTTYTDTGLTPGTTYSYRVREDGPVIQSDYNPAVTLTTPAAQAAPVEPTGVNVTVTGATTATVQWADTNNGAASYIVQVTPCYWSASDAVWTTVAQTGAGVTHCNVTGLTAQDAYYLRICATDGGGQSDYTANTIFYTASPGTGSAKVYTIGPGKEYASLGAFNWSLLGPGDTVEIFPNRDGNGNIIPYYEKPLISVRGTAAEPINIVGMPDPTTGQLPIIDGTNATTSSQWTPDYFPLENTALVLVGPSEQEAEVSDFWSPGYFNLQNLQIQNGYEGAAADQGTGAPLTFTASDGSTQDYCPSTSGIYFEKGDHITIEGCTVTGNNMGIFGAGSGDARDLIDITLNHNYFYGNGTVGDETQHNTYLEGVNTTYEFNDYGPLRQGSGGDNLKDRGAGTVIEYNTFTGGGHLIDLDETENYATYELTLPQYSQTYVFGNILVDTDLTYNVVNYGGDEGMAPFYRKGTLYFYDNTVYMQADQSQAYAINVFETTDAMESVDAVNNIFYITPQTPGDNPPILDLMDPWGVGFFENNWISPGSYSSLSGWDSYYPESGIVAGLASTLTNDENDPGFASMDPSSPDFLMLNANAQVVGQSAVLPANCPPVLYEYSSTTSDMLRTSDLDLGAYEA